MSSKIFEFNISLNVGPSLTCKLKLLAMLPNIFQHDYVSSGKLVIAKKCFRILIEEGIILRA
jgi:hypothetical protein